MGFGSEHRWKGGGVMGLTVPTPGTMTLLWTNPSPKAALSPQMIPADTQKYDFILLICKNGISMAPVIGGDDPTVYEISCGTNAAAGAYQTRNYQIKTNGVSMGSAAQGGVKADNSYAVPILMYGIKI